jgi:5,10-methylenetetrahydrofolate reductase
LRISEITKSREFVRLIELFPPGLPVPELMRDSQTYDLALRFQKLVESINALETLADGFSLPELKDSDRIHLNSIGLASELRKKTTSAIIPTITLRDSNRQNILGAIAYAIYAEIENLLIVRGDPYPDDVSSPKNVYDVRNIASIVSTIRAIESHLTNGSRLCILSPINLQKIGKESYVETIKSRELSGVDIFLAESLFEDVETYMGRIRASRKAGIMRPIIHNIFPLRGYDDALICKNKFGWQISDRELQMLKSKGSDFGLQMARQRYRGLIGNRGLADGACISTRGDIETARQITS